jgi:hypothetical protein
LRKELGLSSLASPFFNFAVCWANIDAQIPLSMGNNDGMDDSV